MKYTQNILLLFLLFSFIYCTDDTCKGSANSLSDCENLITDYQKNSIGDRCCYFTAQDKNGANVKQCLFVEKEGYDNIKDVINAQEDFYDKVHIDCKSYYLHLSLLSLLLILL